MLIVCPNCATSYDVAVASLRPNGRRVRCVRCKEVWQAELSHSDKLMAAAEALAPVRRAVEAISAEATAEAAAGEGDAATDADPALPHIQTQAEAWFDGPEDDPSAGTDPFAEDAPPLVPTDLDADSPPAGAAREPDGAGPAMPSADIETLAAQRYPENRRWLDYLRWPLSAMQSVILVLLLLDAIVIGWRSDFVRLMPQTASFYARLGLPVNLRGLVFDNLNTQVEQHEGVPILVVEGEIFNETRRIIDVPRLRFAVRNAARQEIYSWTAVLPRTLLSPHDAVPFRTRLASPPPDAHDVLVRFITRQDIISGAH